MTKYEDLTYEDKQNALDEAWEEMNPKIETDAERLGRINKLFIYRDEKKHNFRKVSESDFLFLVNETQKSQALRVIAETWMEDYYCMKKEKNQLYKALDFYADENNYKDRVIAEWGPMMEVLRDGGHKAKLALRGESD